MKISEMMKLASDQLDAGKKIEEEHKKTIEYLITNPDTPLKKVYEMIAKDHLSEFEFYYSLLKAMEVLGKDLKTNPLQKQLMTWFGKHPNPNDEEVHKLAEELKINPHELETNIYGLLSKLLSLKP